MELKSYLDNHPDRAMALENLHRFADLGEYVILTSFVDPCILEPLAVLMGGSIADIDEGMDGVSFLWTNLREEYLARCDRAGFDRREKCKIPVNLPGRS
jgi:hypothetical protein